MVPYSTIGLQPRYLVLASLKKIIQPFSAAVVLRTFEPSFVSGPSYLPPNLEVDYAFGTCCVARVVQPVKVPPPATRILML